MIPFKAVAIDMDGTFLRDDKSYDKKLFSELLNKMKERDIHFIVASGNQFERTRLDFTEYWEDMSFVAENGMYLVDDGKDLSYEQLDRSLVEELVEFMAQRPELTPALCGKENAYLEKNSDSKFVKMMKYYLPKHKIVDSFEQLPDDVFFKFTVDVPKEKTLSTVDEINKKFAGRVFATSSGFGNFDLILPHVNKAVGLEKMLASLNLTLDDLVAFGDGGNDLEMLKAAGLSYAMENGSDEVKKVADKIAPNNNDSGVLKVLADYLM